MKIPFTNVRVDERFLNHRLRSTSIGGLAATAVAVGLFEYRYFHDHIVSWDLIAVAATAVVVKFAVLAWYRFKD
jgi:hypothetical protein